MRYKVQVFGWTLIWSSAFIFAYLGWQLYGTDIVTSGVQAEAREVLTEELEVATPEVETIDPVEYFPPDVPPPSEVPDAVQLFTEPDPDTGEAFAFLSIEKIGISDLVIYEGVDLRTLRSGPGHMESTPLPGQPGNSVVSGHRTTYGRPFFDFDLLEIGDEIVVTSGVGTHTYRIREIEVVKPTALWVTDFRPGSWLTLTTCNPKFSARQRLVVWAEMVAGPNLDFADLHKAKFSDPA